MKIYHGKNTNIVRKVQEMFDKVCKDNIDINFQNNINDDDILIVNFTKTKQINAFALISEYRKNRMYIDIICSKRRGLGRKMLNLIEKIAKRRKRIKIIEVHSLKDSINFYKKNNFIESSNPCKPSKIKRKVYGNELIRLTKCIH